MRMAFIKMTVHCEDYDMIYMPLKQMKSFYLTTRTSLLAENIKLTHHLK